MAFFGPWVQLLLKVMDGKWDMVLQYIMKEGKGSF
jgi:hypothetical protein